MMRQRFPLLVSTTLAILSAFFLSGVAAGTEYVVLPPKGNDEAASALRRALGEEGLSLRVLRHFDALGGMLLDIDEAGAERLKERAPDLAVIPAALTFRVDPAASPVESLTKPWHVSWSENAGLTTGIGDVQWSGVTVAVLDSGVNSHDDFGNARIRWDLAYNTFSGGVGASAVYDDYGHGTEVTGVLVGSQTGVVPPATLVPVKCADRNGVAPVEEVTKAVDYLLTLKTTTFSGKHMVANFSYSSGVTPGANKDLAVFFTTILHHLEGAGILFVGAAGNQSSNLDVAFAYPASVRAANAVACAATVEAGGLASLFSNYGSNTVEVAAPGSGIVTTDARNGYATTSGTSFAAPVVSGVATALWARFPSLEVWQVRNVLMDAVENPRWHASPGGASTALPVLAGEELHPDRTTDAAFVESHKGSAPYALTTPPAGGGGSGGCVAGTPQATWFLLTIPLLANFYGAGLKKKRKRSGSG